MAVSDLTRIEEKLDRATAGAVAISDNIGGVMFTNMAEVMEFAKLMSLAGNAVPKHLRGNPGSSLAVCIQALEWRMSPFSVASQSFEVGDKIAYMSQLIHAVVEARAPLQRRLRARYDGEGSKRTCTVIGHFKNEPDPVEYTTPEIGSITPKNSPLWKNDPDQQLWYFAVRAFARRYCPDVLLGIYAEDELERTTAGPDTAVDVTPKPDVKARLAGGKTKRGFSAAHVEAETAQTVTEPAAEPTPPADKPSKETPAQRGARLLAQCETAADVNGLESSIADELHPDDAPAWHDACRARREALPQPKAA